MQTALNNNEVLLWGINVVPSDILKPYDVGNKNPKSIIQRGKSKKEVKELNMKEKEDKEPEEVEEVEKPIIRKPDEKFSYGAYYNYHDIPFLEKEYKIIEDLIEEMHEADFIDGEFDEDESERIDKIIEDRGYNNLMSDIGSEIIRLKATIPAPKIPIPIPIKPTKKITTIDGKGFKKGSPEALEHAKKMREGKLKKEKPIVEVTIKKARAVKGSEEAKEIGKRLAEAKKAKKAIQTQIAPVVVVEKPIEPTTVKKPWFYIGEIPPRYREATMDEAILHNMVSEYGKYKVDANKYKFYKNYGIFLSFELTDLKITAQTSAIKKRIENIDKKLETLDIKADNQSDESKKALLLWEIKELSDERKDVIKAYNWLMGEYYYRKNKPYIKEDFTIVIPKINEAKKILEKPDIKKIEQNTKIINAKKTKKELQEEYAEIYVKNGIEVIIKRDYFDENKKLKSEKAFELEKAGIILDKSLYKLEDYKKIIYIPKFLQSDDILEELQSDLKMVVKAKKVNTSKAIKEPAKPFNINEYEPEIFKKRTKEEEKEYYEKRKKEAYERADKEEAERINKAKISTDELDSILKSVTTIPIEPEIIEVIEEPKTPKAKKAKKVKVVENITVLTPKMEEEHNIIEFMEDEEDEFLQEMVKSNNEARAEQIKKLSEKLGIKIVDKHNKQ